MQVSIDLCIIPIGVGVSLSPFIAICQKEIENAGLEYQLGPNGTAIEGEWEKVFACIKCCHQRVHALVAQRIHTSIKVNTRTDREEIFREKVQRVKADKELS